MRTTAMSYYAVKTLQHRLLILATILTITLILIDPPAALALTEPEQQQQQQEEEQQQQQQPKGRNRQRHLHQHSFPSSQERYDFQSFDPETLFGSPYGGYSRATRGKLASLPLRFVGHGMMDEDWSSASRLTEGLTFHHHHADETKESKGIHTENTSSSHNGDKNVSSSSSSSSSSKLPYFRIRDGEGRPYVCRVYNEDELEPDSVTESMFDAPKIRQNGGGVAAVVSDDDGLDGGGDDVHATAENFEGSTTNKDKAGATTTTASPPTTTRGWVPAVKSETAENSNDDSHTADNEKEATPESQSSATKTTTTTTKSSPLDPSHGEINSPKPIDPNEIQTSTGDPNGDKQNPSLLQLRRRSHVGRDDSDDTKNNNVNKDDQGSGTTTTTTGGDKNTAVQTRQKMMVHIHPPDIARQLSKLDGMCSQLHLGWWSYEWCHGKYVTQFHVEVESAGEDADDKDDHDDDNDDFFDDDDDDDDDDYEHSTEKRMIKRAFRQLRRRKQLYRIEGVTKIGTFTERHVRVDDGHGHRYRGPHEVEGELTGVIVVTDTFDSGDVCEETGDARRMEVEIRCCHHDHDPQLTGGSSFLSGGGSMDKWERNFAMLMSIKEDEVCQYRAKVCTPLLCSDAFMDLLEEEEEAKKGGGDKGDVRFEKKKRERWNDKSVRKKKENESIREILDRTLGNACLQRNAGWWVYEFCHTRHARQFHATTMLDKLTGFTKQAIESEHKLGFYDIFHENYPNEEEPNHVINATDSEGTPGDALQKKIGTGGVGSGGAEYGGNGAVFVQEYTHGDVCDQSDVTDAAIKGGNIVEGGIERATTVRFSCGKSFELVKVNEDSTCHYVFDVTVPDLCDHPLFKAPEVKTQVVKCLPVDN